MTDKQLARLFNAGSGRALTETKVAYDAFLFNIANSVIHNDKKARACVDAVYKEIFGSVNETSPDEFGLYICAKVRRAALTANGISTESPQQTDEIVRRLLEERNNEGRGTLAGFIKRNWAWLLGGLCVIILFVLFITTGADLIVTLGFAAALKEWISRAFIFIFAGIVFLVAIIYYLRHKGK